MRHHYPLDNLESVSEIHQYMLSQREDSEGEIDSAIFDRIEQNGINRLALDCIVVLYCDGTESQNALVRACITKSSDSCQFNFRSVDLCYNFSATILSMVADNEDKLLLLVYLRKELDDDSNERKYKSAITTLATLRFVSHTIYTKNPPTSTGVIECNVFSSELEGMIGAKFNSDEDNQPVVHNQEDKETNSAMEI